MTQAMGRIDRIGQKHKPTIRIAVAENTIQTKLAKSLLQKDSLVSAIEGKKSLRDILLGC
jgi:SNF2 family DNA or RNA helicase